MNPPVDPLRTVDRISAKDIRMMKYNQKLNEIYALIRRDREDGFTVYYDRTARPNKDIIADLTEQGYFVEDVFYDSEYCIKHDCRCSYMTKYIISW
jgi:hypothetical protein